MWLCPKRSKRGPQRSNGFSYQNQNGKLGYIGTIFGLIHADSLVAFIPRRATWILKQEQSCAMPTDCWDHSETVKIWSWGLEIEIVLPLLATISPLLQLQKLSGFSCRNNICPPCNLNRDCMSWGAGPTEPMLGWWRVPAISSPSWIVWKCELNQYRDSSLISLKTVEIAVISGKQQLSFGAILRCFVSCLAWPMAARVPGHLRMLPLRRLCPHRPQLPSSVEEHLRKQSLAKGKVSTCSLQPWRCSASDFRWLWR